MKKIDLSSRVSRKTSLIALLCILLFLIAGITVAVVTHSSYLKNAEGKIVNYGMTPSSDLSLRQGTLSTLVYKYADDAKSVDINDVIEISKGATYSVDLVLSADLTPLGHTGTAFSVENGERYFLLVTVKSAGNVYQNKYILELVRKSDYKDETPDFHVKADADAPYVELKE